MSITRYKTKRKFDNTPEPKNSPAKKSVKKIFVAQRHEARSLHYDFRLEAEGVLKSWAIPKGPSMNPNDKRLAVMVEDHPLAYAKFEGLIPEGNYGAGVVDIWDHGTYKLDGTDDTAGKTVVAQLKKGRLKFFLSGKKLKGSFSLVKFKGKESDQWLLIKGKDEYAVDEPYDCENFISEKKARSKKYLTG